MYYWHLSFRNDLNLGMIRNSSGKFLKAVIWIYTCWKEGEIATECFLLPFQTQTLNFISYIKALNTPSVKLQRQCQASD